MENENCLVTSKSERVTNNKCFECEFVGNFYHNNHSGMNFIATCLRLRHSVSADGYNKKTTKSTFLITYKISFEFNKALLTNK